MSNYNIPDILKQYNNDKIKAIKHLTREHGLGLKEAKDLVDGEMSRNPSDYSTPDTTALDKTNARVALWFFAIILGICLLLWSNLPRSVLWILLSVAVILFIRDSAKSAELQKSIPKQVTQTGQEKTKKENCENCGANIKKGASVCEYCRSAV